MKAQQALPLGVLFLSLAFAGCSGGGSLPQGGSSPNNSTAAVLVASRLHREACAATSTSVNFNGTPISKGSWLLFSSVLSEQGTKGTLRLSVRQSFVTLRVGQTHYTIEGPNMDLALESGSTVRLRFPAYGDHWRMIAPYSATGSDFLNSIAYQTTSHLPGSITNVTWSAKFYGRDDRPIKWRWGAAVYTKLSNQYAALKTEPLTDPRYSPYNRDPAGTPEAFKQYVIAGGTGDGGKNYTGSMSSAVTVTPCDG
ncbi:MAG: hypothetical protein WB438_12750 [Candidatus Cybelea sp.]